MKKIFSFFWNYPNQETDIPEGLFADEITNQELKQKIMIEYNKTHSEPEQTPFTHPWKFDPFNPPTGFKYDPYYECWVRV